MSKLSKQDNLPEYRAPKKQYPQIYVFEDMDPRWQGWLKVGYTTRKKAEDRVKEQFNTKLQLDSEPYKLYHVENAIDDIGKLFTDKDIHRVLIAKGIRNKGEFFYTDIDTVKSTILEYKTGIVNLQKRTQIFKMRKEQEDAVNQAYSYFQDNFKKYPNDKPKFLWNAKMRFGKTFAAYQLALKAGFKKILVITYKPAVEQSWKDDLLSHVDFLDWQFISRNSNNIDTLDRSKPHVYFASFQDLLGTTEDGETKEHNEWIHGEKWDIVIQDEYHYGAWRDTAKELLDADDNVDKEDLANLDNYNDKSADTSINGKCYLYLSGTPFRAIETGEFTEEQIFNWTYADEQRAKNAYKGDNNPYASLPEMMILTYKLPDNLIKVAQRGEFDEFSLGYFFKAEGEYENARFVNEEQVQSWLNLIRGAIKEDVEKDLLLGKSKPAFPFTDRDLYKILTHMLWFLPDVASCCAMANLLAQPHNSFYNSDYEIIVAAGKYGGSGVKALEPLQEAMGNPLKTKTITLTCGKLTTGVTVKPWTGIFMLRTLNSPESYFQSAFRVQSPWTIPGEDGETIINKNQCFVFDFDPNRALYQIAQYAGKLSTKDVNPEEKINEFIKYLPILAYDGFMMEKIDAAGLLDISMGQTTSTMLAKGWNNALLVNVDNDTLKKLIKNEKAMEIINSIESFRKKDDKNINKVIISKSDKINKLQTKKDNKEELSDEEKKTLNEEQKKYNKEREMIRNKLKTLATRIPLFMYLTDYREEKLTDVITKIEPELFEKVTGLTIEDFELLVDLGLFNSELMNNVVYKFRKYEDASMSYSGINRHEGEIVAGFDEVKVNKSQQVNPDYITKGKEYISRRPLYENVRVYFYRNKFYLPKGSQIRVINNHSKLTEVDKVFTGLTEAAKFITGDESVDIGFFKL